MEVDHMLVCAFSFYTVPHNQSYLVPRFWLFIEFSCKWFLDLVVCCNSTPNNLDFLDCDQFPVYTEYAFLLVSQFIWMITLF